jgi:hypothetical protein
VLPTILVEKDDCPIRKHKDLSVEHFDGLFLAMIFHFLAANIRMKTVSLLSFILMLINAFLEYHLLIVATGYRENPKITINDFSNLQERLAFPEHARELIQHRQFFVDPI